MKKLWCFLYVKDPIYLTGIIKLDQYLNHQTYFCYDSLESTFDLSVQYTVNL